MWFNWRMKAECDYGRKAHESQVQTQLIRECKADKDAWKTRSWERLVRKANTQKIVYKEDPTYEKFGAEDYASEKAA